MFDIGAKSITEATGFLSAVANPGCTTSADGASPCEQLSDAPNTTSFFAIRLLLYPMDERSIAR
jgi:hypothetical protein